MTTCTLALEFASGKNHCLLFKINRLSGESQLFIILFKLAQSVKFELVLINLQKTQLFMSIVNGPLFGFTGSEAKFDVRVRFAIRELGSIGFRAVWHINDQVSNRCVKHLFSPF